MQLLLISGSTRRNSTNAAALECVSRTAPEGSTTITYQGLPGLPAFNPDEDTDPLPAPVHELRAAIADSDAVVICTPEYAGTLPGSLKNLLDWTVGGTELADKPVAWINVAAPGRGHGAIATLETVLGYVGAKLIPPACITASISRDALAADGSLTDAALCAQISAVWDALSTAEDGSTTSA